MWRYWLVTGLWAASCIRAVSYIVYLKKQNKKAAPAAACLLLGCAALVGSVFALRIWG